MSRVMILSLVVVLALAAILGLRLGQAALPPGETEIILAQAARYQAQTGGDAHDCQARPAAVAGVRLVVTCGADWAVAVDRWGRPVPLPNGGPGT
jgi:hypothetical protein